MDFFFSKNNMAAAGLDLPLRQQNPAGDITPVWKNMERSGERTHPVQ